MLTYVLGPILAFLPARWREKWFAGWAVNWGRAGAISGFVESFGCLLALIGWYLYRIQALSDQQLDPMLTATRGAPGYGAGMAIGFAALMTFLFDPRTWVLTYGAVEGAVRTVSALVNDEASGIGPLALADWMIGGAKQRAYERRVPLVPDRVTRGGEKEEWALKVESCRPKPTWKYPLTVYHQEEYFQVWSEDPASATPGRPHVYLLKRVPAGEAYRGVEPYDPNDVMVPRKPGLMGLSLQAVRDGIWLKTLPLVVDKVERIVGAAGVFLEVESCRPKTDWAPGRVIRFEGCFYRLESCYDAKPPRPFGYRLELLPMGVPGRTVTDYSPEDILRKPQV